MPEKAKFRKIPFYSVPCRTYACSTMASLSIGGSDAAQFEWHHLCLPCAVNLVESAFEIPELREVILRMREVILRKAEDHLADYAKEQVEAKLQPEQKEKYERPQQAELRSPPEKFPCPYCEFDAANAGGLSTHIRAKHPQDEALK